MTPAWQGLSEPLRLQAKQHPGELREETEQMGEVDAESLMGTQVAAAHGWRHLQSVFHSGVGVGVVDGRVGLPRDGEAWWAAVYGVAQSQT